MPHWTLSHVSHKFIFSFPSLGPPPPFSFLSLRFSLPSLSFSSSTSPSLFLSLSFCSLLHLSFFTSSWTFLFPSQSFLHPFLSLLFRSFLFLLSLSLPAHSSRPPFLPTFSSLSFSSFAAHPAPLLLPLFLLMLFYSLSSFFLLLILFFHLRKLLTRLGNTRRTYKTTIKTTNPFPANLSFSLSPFRFPSQSWSWQEKLITGVKEKEESYWSEEQAEG